MKNYEKYEKELEALQGFHIGVNELTGEPENCASLSCLKCKFHGICCDSEKFKWLLSESVPTVDWTKVPVDTLVLVRDSDSMAWQYAYFACYSNGRVHVWRDGTTSKTVKEYWINKTFPWAQAKLAEEDK